jgi:hypothetical protein
VIPGVLTGILLEAKASQVEIIASVIFLSIFLTLLMQASTTLLSPHESLSSSAWLRS